MVSKPPELKIPTEEKQCNTLEQIQPAAQSSGLEDESQDSIQSILDNLDTLESDDDFDEEGDRHSTGPGTSYTRAESAESSYEEGGRKCKGREFNLL